MSKVEQRLAAEGFQLPTAPAPAAAYVPAVRTGNLVFISGQGTMVNGEWTYQGRVGEKYTLEEGYKAAQVAILNALAVLKQEIGDLDRVKRIVKVLGWVNCPETFNQQPYVINGASELLEKVFGERGKHARSAVSAHTLPFDTTVEIEMIVEVE
ncbi:MAG: RidA family protein [Firmicutes bacterium]|nr:RidA family protein [Bacillota bacterium]